VKGLSRADYSEWLRLREALAVGTPRKSGAIQERLVSDDHRGRPLRPAGHRRLRSVEIRPFALSKGSPSSLFSPCRLLDARSSTANNVEDNEDYGDDQQEMDESPAEM